MLRRTTLVLVFFALSGGLAAAAPVAAPQPPATLPALPGTRAVPAALGIDVVQELNRVRAAHSLRPLRPSRALAASARRHSAQMGRRGFFDHDSADGTPFWRRIERFYGDTGFRRWAVGENIFWQSPRTLAAIGVIRSWMGSPGHRENVLSGQWRDVGVGAVNMLTAPGVYGGSPVTIVTVDFGNRRR
jgi:uncharacterized protein YkwD